MLITVHNWTDEDLIAAVAASTSWVQVAQAVGISRQGAVKAARKLELDTSHFAYPANRSLKSHGSSASYRHCTDGDDGKPCAVCKKWFADYEQQRRIQRRGGASKRPRWKYGDVVTPTEKTAHLWTLPPQDAPVQGDWWTDLGRD